MKPNRLNGSRVAAMAFLSASVSCTLLLDHSSVQCHSDDDCVHFGHHPYCDQKANLCVQSGLSPKDCFFATPTNPPTTLTDFLNQCTRNALGGTTVGECLSFSRPTDPDIGLKEPMTMAAPPQASVPTPVTLCKNVAPGGTVIYMSGSSNFPPLLEKLAAIIADNTDLRVTPVFKTTSSCVGSRAMLQTSPTYATDHTIRDPVSATDTNYAQYVNAGKLTPCLLGPTGAAVDVGESEIYASTCGYTIKDADNVLEGPGPILPILFVVPGTSMEKLISAQAARQVFGVGGMDPWLDWNHFYVRGGGTATAQLVGREIGVPANKLWGVDQGTAQALAQDLRGVTYPPMAEISIGILGADFFDDNRTELKALAYQAVGQRCAFLPDSSSGSKDKINVRDGHYPIWGPMHFFYARTGLTPSRAAAEFVELFSLPVIPTEMLDALISSGFVPKCAMTVQRDGEVGVAPGVTDPFPSFTIYRPSRPCGCHFDSVVGKTPDHCQVCTMDAGCPQHQVCNYGFCEAEPN